MNVAAATIDTVAKYPLLRAVINSQLDKLFICTFQKSPRSISKIPIILILKIYSMRIIKITHIIEILKLLVDPLVIGTQ